MAKKATSTPAADDTDNEPVKCECRYWEVGTDLDPAFSREDDIVTTGCLLTTRRTFAPGHDAKLKSLLIRAGVFGWEARYGRITGTLTTMDPISAANRYGFGPQVRVGIERGKRAAEAKANRVARRAAAKKAGSKATKAIAKAADAPPPREVPVKVVAPKMPNVPAAQPATDDKARDELAALVGTEKLPTPGYRRVVAKVGRWEYEGSLEGDVFTYVDKNQETQKREDGFRVLRDL
jgi:hypothetical protein